MQDDLNQLSDIVQATFGLHITITRLDGTVLNVSGIFRRELIETGSLEGVLVEMTLLVLDRTIALKRGDQVESQQQRWKVDRKLKDDGYLATWNLYDG